MVDVRPENVIPVLNNTWIAVLGEIIIPITIETMDEILNSYNYSNLQFSILDVVPTFF